jgi:phosphoglycerate dehydrogenase-like enzyme
MAEPRVAIRPRGLRGFLADAVAAGGGVVVEPVHADALVWSDPADAAGLAALLDGHPGIRWVQVPFAGVEPLIDVMRAHPERTWTAGQGVYAEEVAEHALALALAGMRHVAGYARTSTWSPPAGTSLLGAEVTLLGGGGIARSLIRLLAPFDCRITVLRRRPEHLAGAERTGTLADLSGVLATTDLLVLALSLTPQTQGIIDAVALDALPRHAWLVNVARGAHVVTDALVDALRSGSIGGAALDVTDPEPLPDAHPLWRLPNCIITPHTANTPEMAVPVLSRRVSDNVRRFGTGEPLLGPVDLEGGY